MGLTEKKKSFWFTVQIVRPLTAEKHVVPAGQTGPKRLVDGTEESQENPGGQHE